MKRRTFLKRAAAGAAALAGAPCATAQAERKPNILFLFADDLAFEALGHVGGEVHTPNLDRLAERGTRFTHTYNSGGWHGAICVASRTMLMTGAQLWRAKAREDTLGQDAQAGRLWPQRLGAAGYETYMSGKWHVKVNAAKVFDHTRHIRPGMPPDTEASYNRPIEGEPDPWKPWDPAQEGFWKGGIHWSEVVADDGVDFLEQASQSDAPFFMYLAFNAPHDPRQSPKAFVERYPVDQVDVPPCYMPLYPHANEIGCDPTRLRDERLAPAPRTEHAVKVHRREYFGIISHLDAQIGRILDALERTDQVGNTRIVFSADHGLSVGHHGLLGKQNMYDPSMRVPFIIAGPGIANGRTIDAPIYLQDIVPTTLAWAGAEIPDDMDFRALTGLLDGGDTAPRDYIYGAYVDLQRMVTDTRHKLVHYSKTGHTYLFDLQNDPHETVNLIDAAAHAPVRERLWSALVGLCERFDDPHPPSRPDSNTG